MMFIEKLKVKYAEFIEKWKNSVENRRIRREKKWERYYLDKYGAYRNADKLSREKVLEVLFQIFSELGYEDSKLTAESDIAESIKLFPPLPWWAGSDADFDVLDEIYSVFDINEEDMKEYMEENAYPRIQTFEQLADLIIKKTKEKKLKEQKIVGKK